MNKICIQFYKTKIGELVIGSFEDKVCMLDFRFRRMRKTIDDRIKKRLEAEFVEKNSEVIKIAKKQIVEYLNGERKEFDVPILMLGSDFQKMVWNALLKVPYGKTSTYSEIAKDIKNEKALRAVASANGANSIALIIPCHRIIGSDGNLVGYSGGVSVKKRLLQLEQKASLTKDDNDTNLKPVQKSFTF